MICDYWFFNHVFGFQDSIYNGCHDLKMLCFNISDIAIITVKGGDYHDINKSEANHSENSQNILCLKIAGIHDMRTIKSILKTVSAIIHVRLMACHNKLKQCKAFKININKELMPVA